MSEEEVDELFKSTIDASNNEVDYRGESLLLCPHIHHAGMTSANDYDRVRQDDCRKLDFLWATTFYASMSETGHGTVVRMRDSHLFCFFSACMGVGNYTCHDIYLLL